LGLVLTWLIVAFWRSTADLHGHTRAGAQIIMSALARQMAPAGAVHGAPHDVPQTAPDAVVTTAPPDDGLQRVHRVLPGLGDPVPVRVQPGSRAAGRTLGHLQLRTLTGAVVLAITRGDAEVLLPVGHEVLEPGDVLALAGTSEAIDRARRLLEVGG
jgi:CPA2 family monovalent cation:H+ antiporter-2